MNSPWPSPVPSTTVHPGGSEAQARLRPLVHAMYALHTLSWLSFGLLSVVAMVLNYAKRDSLPSAFYASHFRWQARSFWFTLLWLVVTSPLWVLLVFPGYIAWFLVGLWYLYRFVRGWWAFAENRPMPVPEP